MNTKKIAYLLAFVLFFGVAFYAKAADDERYLVKSTSGVWKKYFGVRHSFDNGFTADLSGFQIRFAKIFGLEIEPVNKLYVLPEENLSSAAKPENPGKGNKGSGGGERILPADQMPWGVEMIYNDPLLIESSGGDGVNVAVLDTGVLTTHLDLVNRIKGCKDFTQR